MTKTSVSRSEVVPVDVLRTQGPDTVFTVSGESFLGALDALYDVRNEVSLIVCRYDETAPILLDTNFW